MSAAAPTAARCPTCHAAPGADVPCSDAFHVAPTAAQTLDALVSELESAATKWGAATAMMLNPDSPLRSADNEERLLTAARANLLAALRASALAPASEPQVRDAVLRWFAASGVPTPKCRDIDLWVVGYRAIAAALASPSGAPASEPQPATLERALVHAADCRGGDRCTCHPAVVTLAAPSRLVSPNNEERA